MYTIHFKPCNQNDVNFWNLKDEDYDFPSFLNYKEILNHSIKEFFIKDESEIKSFCDGCDDYPAYFSANTAEEECCAVLENSCDEIFEDDIHEYDAF